MMKKNISIVLVLLTAVAAVFCGCADRFGPAVTTTADTDSVTVKETEATETGIADDLPVTDYKGREFRILCVDGYSNQDVYTEDHETSEPLHDAVFKRNNNVKDRFGVNIIVELDAYDRVTTKIETLVKAGTDDYDMCFVQMVNGAKLAQTNSVLTIRELPYIDLSKPWWDKATGNAFSIRNNIMMINGDISPTSFNYTSCIYFNKNLFDKYDLEYPYKLVEEGKWTLDRFYEYTKGYSVDKDGDGVVNPRTSTVDILCYCGWNLSIPYDLYYGAGGMLVFKDADDVPYYAPNIERDSLVYDKIYKIVIENNAYFETDATHLSKVVGTFVDGRALFFGGSFYDIPDLRDMDDNYGFIPEPKLYEKDEYRSFVNGAASMICIPSTVKPENREFVSVIIEGMASESYRTITPVLKEQYLKRKATRDAESIEMIDCIIRNRTYDMAYVNMMDSVGSYVRDALKSKKTDITSTLKRFEKSASKQIERLVATYDKSVSSN